MNLDDMRARRRIAEKQIKDVLAQFMDDTGLRIYCCDVHLAIDERIGMEPKCFVTQVEIKVRL